MCVLTAVTRILLVLLLSVSLLPAWPVFQGDAIQFGTPPVLLVMPPTIVLVALVLFLRRYPFGQSKVAGLKRPAFLKATFLGCLVAILLQASHVSLLYLYPHLRAGYGLFQPLEMRQNDLTSGCEFYADCSPKGNNVYVEDKWYGINNPKLCFNKGRLIKQALIGFGYETDALGQRLNEGFFVHRPKKRLRAVFYDSRDTWQSAIGLSDSNEIRLLSKNEFFSSLEGLPSIPAYLVHHGVDVNLFAIVVFFAISAISFLVFQVNEGVAIPQYLKRPLDKLIRKVR